MVRTVVGKERRERERRAYLRPDVLDDGAFEVEQDLDEGPRPVHTAVEKR